MASNFNDMTPAAPAGGVNVLWQTDGAGNDSAYVIAGDVVAPTVNAQTADYIAALGDANNIVTMTVAGANTFTVPPNASVAFPIGTTLTVIQLGAGQVTLTAGAGVTFQTPSSATTRAQYSTVAMIKILTDTWILAGDLT